MNRHAFGSKVDPPALIGSKSMPGALTLTPAAFELAFELALSRRIFELKKDGQDRGTLKMAVIFMRRANHRNHIPDAFEPQHRRGESHGGA